MGLSKAGGTPMPYYILPLAVIYIILIGDHTCLLCWMLLTVRLEKEINSRLHKQRGQKRRRSMNRRASRL